LLIGVHDITIGKSYRKKFLNLVGNKG